MSEFNHVSLHHHLRWLKSLLEIVAIYFSFYCIRTCIIRFQAFQACFMLSAAENWNAQRRALRCNSELNSKLHWVTRGGNCNYRSKRGCIIGGARHVYCCCVWRKALGIYWFSAEESCGEKFRPHTITSEKSVLSLELGNGKQRTRNMVDCMLSLISGFSVFKNFKAPRCWTASFRCLFFFLIFLLTFILVKDHVYVFGTECSVVATPQWATGFLNVHRSCSWHSLVFAGFKEMLRTSDCPSPCTFFILFRFFWFLYVPSLPLKFRKFIMPVCLLVTSGNRIFWFSGFWNILISMWMAT